MANPNVEVKYTKLFINNKFVDAVSGKTFPSINPATGKVIAQVAEGDKADIDFAVAAAKEAFKRGSEYRKLDASARGKLLWKLADLFERDINILANLEALDNGKPFQKAIFDVYGCVATFRYFAGWCDKACGKTVPVDGGNFAYTRKEPVGIVGQIIPWNYPLLMLAWKWAPVLATGCVSVLKPAEQTPLSALHACNLAVEAGIPAGVLNVVNGYGPTAGGAITSHPEITKVAFTGSTEVGRIIAKAAADSNLKKVSLELGGKSPLVVMDDVEISEAAKIAHEACFENHGQCCCAGTRTFVHEKIFDAFVAESTRLARERKVGSPFDASVQQGPQVDDESFTKVLSYIESGKKEGAKLQVGGNRIGNCGYFIEPTVFSDVTDNMFIAKEEIFGPVQSILKFKTLDEAIERANATTYGLAAGILTHNLENALIFSNAVEAGSVWVNCFLAITPQTPFGGYKQSGLGRECGEEGMELYQETKTVSIKLPINH
ncbi:aldehyde dehydrogenase X, mitochondrial-like [Sitodiplosis mosellana]|uniref:aldehyde dehydrogenase X, mitochondrial-like n=1 Tax=Sitodiplosis mosellana TaxID=263140 RepID=UPI002443E25D|nr:aldehyde dehydrogenase X, mitochondrial-like [Sitodiplosis mosellana]XP_055322718.1 aldehyde dehydrogenase X, mitochondrial-like [Sitodiplosis mosellana]XP_055322719.1 aldehyde dehydrogenase X, mitochondrial-like [Sitodiplosis mosellana]XP_055322720.1 aldehyde dehydrogenase X, mitochondrial-like [Sitodiplosis mosellana]